MSKRAKRKTPTAVAPGGGRQPANAVGLPSGRRPTVVEQSRSEVCISWRFGGVEMDGPWGWHRLDLATATHLRDKLAHFETMTWADLINSTHNKRIPVGNLGNRARQRLTTIGLDDIDELWELRLNGKQRIWGRRNGDVLHLLWWDPEHEVCPSQLKRT